KGPSTLMAGRLPAPGVCSAFGGCDAPPGCATPSKRRRRAAGGRLEDGDGLGVVAGGGVPGAVVDERRRLVDAALPLGVGQVVGELWAAGAEAAAARGVERAGGVAAQQDRRPHP